MEKVIEFHPATLTATRWIGIDLNTTGHVAVAADPSSEKVMKLGKNISYVQCHSTKKCMKLWRDSKLWKLKKVKSRERKNFKTALYKISRQIVTFAESLGSGIKFENLFSKRYSYQKTPACSFEFSFQNGSFFSLQLMVEKQAYKRGIPVIYVDPACTSKRCSRCGGIGRRYRKRFACPHCGYITHADVNAALNIAAVSFCLPAPEGLFCAGNGQKRIPKKEARRFLRAGIPAGSPAQAVQGIEGGGKLPAVLE